MEEKNKNIHKIYATLGASNHSKSERVENDYYATSPLAVKMLLEKEPFSKNIWECASGGDHIVKVLKENGQIFNEELLTELQLNTIEKELKDESFLVAQDLYDYALEQLNNWNGVQLQLDLSINGLKERMVIPKDMAAVALDQYLASILKSNSTDRNEIKLEAGNPDTLTDYPPFYP